MTDATQQLLKEAHIKQIWTTLTDGEDFIPVDHEDLPVGLEDVLNYPLLAFCAVGYRSTIKAAPKGVTLWTCHTCSTFAMEFEEQGLIDRSTTIYQGDKVICDPEIFVRDYNKYV